MSEVDKLRNIVLLSHSGAGKTSVCEALLFNSNTITRLGRVDDGNTVSDYEPEEVKRKGSIQTSIIPCAVGGNKLNILDTPGYDDFVGEVVSALRVADGAIIVMSASSGAEVGTEKGWQRCEEVGIPRMFFINKMDRENADFYRSLESIQTQFGRTCVPFQIPIGAEQSFTGIVDLLAPLDQIPSEIADEVQSARERLIEAVAETDDELATRYLEGETLSQEEITAGLRKGVLSGNVVPVLVGSATMNIGIEELGDAATKYLPSPMEGRPASATASSGEETVEIAPEPDGPLVAFVFKTTADQFVGKMSIFRIYRGSVKANSEVWNESKKQTERIGSVYVLRGKTQEQVQEIGAGDIGAIAKLTVTTSGDTLCQRDAAVEFASISFPVGHYSVAVNPKTKADVEKMSSALARISEEDPSLRVSREAETSETLVSGLGETHVAVAMDKVRRKFGADLELQLPKVPYRETITTVTKSEYKHKKQTGGHGQYGHVLLRLEPLERGEGFAFAAEVVGGSVPKEYIPSVQKGIVKVLQDGVLAGYPVVDLRAVLYDGSFHNVDSSGIAFEIAGSHAFQKGVADAQPQLLEPIVKLTVIVPDSFNGDVMGDLNGKRGRIIGMTPMGGETVIEADVPQAEILRYATELRSMTQGRGRYTVEFSHHDQAPTEVTQKVVEEAKKAKEDVKA